MLNPNLDYPISTLETGKKSPYDMSDLEEERCKIVQAVDVSLVHLNERMLSTCASSFSIYCQHNCCL